MKENPVAAEYAIDMGPNLNDTRVFLEAVRYYIQEILTENDPR